MVEEVSVRFLQARLFEFLHHHAFLGSQGTVAELQLPHPVALQIQRRFDVGRGEDVVVQRRIRAGGRVIVPARHLEEVVEIVHVLTPREHEVLEEVGEARAPGGVVAATYFVQNVDGHDGALRVVVQQDGEAVVQRIGIEIDQGRLGLALFS